VVRYWKGNESRSENTDIIEVSCIRNGESRKRRVYFLGAGASKAFYPSVSIASQLTLEHLLQPEHYDDRVGPRIAIPALSEFIARHSDIAAMRKEPLEKVLGNLRDFGEPYWPYINCVVCLLWRAFHQVNFRFFE
jgi:hypothetical protein